MASPVPKDPPPPYTPPGSVVPPPYGTQNDDRDPGSGIGGETAKDESYPPGAPPYGPACSSTTLLIDRERKPPTFFLLSLVTCLCFSPLFGIVAIIFSALSHSAWNSGDVASAKRYSQVAVSLSVVGILVTIFAMIIVFATGAIRFQD